MECEFCHECGRYFVDGVEATSEQVAQIDGAEGGNIYQCEDHE